METEKQVEALVDDLKTSGIVFLLLALLGVGYGLLIFFFGHAQADTVGGYVVLGFGLTLGGVSSILRGLARAVNLMHAKRESDLIPPAASPAEAPGQRSASA